MSNVTLTHGVVTVTLPGHLAPPVEAGRLSPVEVQSLPKSPHGIGLACAQAADGIDKAGAQFAPPPGVTAASIRLAGRRAEEIDGVIQDLEVILTTAKQANLLFDAEAWRALRRVNDQVKSQAKDNPG